MNQLPGLTPAWLIILGMVIGTTIITFIPISIAGGEAIKANDWIGFAGSVVGAVMTIIAAMIAWFAVKQQIASQERAFERQKKADEDRERTNYEHAKFAAVVVLTQPVHATAAIAMVNSRLINLLSDPLNPGETATIRTSQISIQYQNLDVAFAQLESALNFFGVGEAWRDLDVNAKSIYLTIVGTLQTINNIYKQPPPNFDRVKVVERRDKALRNLQTYIRAFDNELADSFDKDYPPVKAVVIPQSP